MNSQKDYTTSAAAWTPRQELKQYLTKYCPFSEKINEDNFEDFCYQVGNLALIIGTSERKNEDPKTGGTTEDVRVAFSAGANIAIPDDFYANSARQTKSGVSKKLRKIFENDKVDDLIYFLTGVERNASCKIVNHKQCDGIGEIEDDDQYYEIGEEDVKILEKQEIDEKLAEEWADTLILYPSEIPKKIRGENWTKTREKPGSKPAKRENKQLTLSLY